MRIFIDTSNSEKIVIGIGNQWFEAKSHKEKSQIILAFIDKILKKKGKKIEDITEIEVNTGPGSFTGLRVGVSVANALAWALNVPVNGKYLGKGEIVEIRYD